METIEAALRAGVRHLQRGEVQQADQICKQIIDVAGGCAEVWELRAAIAARLGKEDQAVEFLRRALQIDPGVARYHARLGVALSLQGKQQAAEESLRRAIELQHDFAEAHDYLGIVLQARGAFKEAVSAHRRALEIRPNFVAAWFNLGTTCERQGLLDEAINCFQRAAQLKPDHAETHIRLAAAFRRRGLRGRAINCYRQALRLKAGVEAIHNELANTLREDGRLEEAIDCLQHAQRLFPGSLWVHNNLGFALRERGRLDEAIESLQRALKLKPDAAALNNLGNTFRDKDLIDEAVDCFRRALELEPDLADAHNNLGNALKDQGLLDEAIASYRRAVAAAPHAVGIHSNFLNATYLHSGYDAQKIYDEHRRWNQRHAEPLAKFIQGHANDRSLDRPLRIGYVSPDFRGHPVGLFLRPVLESHNHRDFTIYCYASVQSPDAMTEICRTSADVWQDVLGRSDAQVAQLIREDRIDILVDLSMHMLPNRLLTFARKPAPIQVSYLAYCGTTGLSAIDYRLTDPYLDSPGEDKEYYAEKSVHLPQSYWCYHPVMGALDVQPPPLLQTGAVTFGCLNNFAKVSAATLATWGRLLCEVPDARLLIHAQVGPHRNRILRDYAENRGISPEHITFVGEVPFADYCQNYHKIDIALDPFPWGGGTTTCDALWMGVPVVSLAGQTAVGRGGLSILSNIGLADLVARDTDEYVSLAAELARDRERLGELRTTLRERMQNSPLMDSEGFTRNLEAVYRRIWHRWCVRQSK